VQAGAGEIDMVIDRGAFLAGDYGTVFEQIVAVKEACGDAHLKVILETGELGTLDHVRRASWLAMRAGADFIKTSTGKLNPAATLEAAAIMLAVIRDCSRPVGFKAAGGIRDTAGAASYLHLSNALLGPGWATPATFRFGASGLADALLADLGQNTAGQPPSSGY
jgi:deoxyribose-phosphate aldolase